MKILCLIPARSGSKGLKDKNIRDFKGKPLLAHSIYQAKNCDYVENMRIIVTTDSQKYADIGKEHGAEAPFIRPSEISQDLSTDLEFMKHSVNWLKENEDYEPDVILQLRPTQPLRKIDDINKTLGLFIQNYNEFDSLRTVIEFEKSPYKMYRIQDNVLEPLFNSVDNITNEPYNQCRQNLPTTYLHNGYIDILKTSLLQNDRISGEKILPYIMNKSDTIDIDTEEDWQKALKH
ncbi:MAG: cytidylyltransferase domain-containing protein [Vampirovibrionia bacterium]